MREALEVFINGIIGVYAGLFALYLAIRLNQWIDGRLGGSTDEKS